MSDGIPSETRIGRVSLTTRDLTKSLEFYSLTLGFSTLKQAGQQASVGAAGKPLLELHSDPKAKPASDATGLYHFAVRLPTRQALAQLVYHLALLQVHLEGFGDHGVSESVYLADPDGNGIEFYRDRPKSQWQRDDQGNLQMGTDEVDLDDLLKLVKPETTWTGLPEGTDMGHVHLRVSDVEKSIVFYRDVIGLELTQRYGTSAAFLSAGGYHHHIGINTWAGKDAPPPPAGSIGLRWVEILVPAAGMSPLQQRLVDTGTTYQSEDDGLMVQDPSKNTLLLMAI